MSAPNTEVTGERTPARKGTLYKTAVVAYPIHGFNQGQIVGVKHAGVLEGVDYYTVNDLDTVPAFNLIDFVL